MLKETNIAKNLSPYQKPAKAHQVLHLNDTGFCLKLVLRLLLFCMTVTHAADTSNLLIRCDVITTTKKKGPHNHRRCCHLFKSGYLPDTLMWLLCLKPHTDMLSWIPHIPLPSEPGLVGSRRVRAHYRKRAGTPRFHPCSSSGASEEYWSTGWQVVHLSPAVPHDGAGWVGGCVRVCVPCLLSLASASFTSVNRPPVDMWHPDLASWW